MIEVMGTAEVNSELMKIADKSIISRALTMAGNALAGQLSAASPVAKVATWVGGIMRPPGGLKAAWKVKTRGNSAYVSNGSFYAQFIERGVRPHVIDLKKKKALKFVLANDTEFSKKVNHPGVTATHFAGRVADRFGPEFGRIIEQELSKELSK